MKNVFVKVACGAPTVHLADTIRNTDELIRLTQEADTLETALIVYPELCLTGYTCGDLFFNEKLILSAKSELKRYLEQTKDCSVISIVGLPLQYRNRLYNCAAVCQGGKLLGVVPKSKLSISELRHFSPASALGSKKTFIHLFEQTVEISADLLFDTSLCGGFRFAVDIFCDNFGSHFITDKWTKKRINILCHPAASPELAGKDSQRRAILSANSQQENFSILYASSGEGESTTDHVFGGHRLICAQGKIAAELLPFNFDKKILYAEIQLSDIPRNTLATTIESPAEDSSDSIDPHPFYPSDPLALENHCRSILKIQAHGLKHRMEKAYAKKAVIGISGGLDSTLALLVAAYTVDLLHRPRTDILAVTMPCFGTTNRTKSNATILCEELGVDFRCIPIGDAVDQHFKDIGHDPLVHDVTYENSQARERTQVLMDVANACGGMVIGTGDLSELALGWATYNGDHMSMYGVNADIPKTLIRHIVNYCAEKALENGSTKLAEALKDILDTPVSPELLPADEQGQIAQKTEDLVGPYELHDFYLYHLLKNGYSPEKLYRLAKNAFGELYSDEILLKWLEIFLRRFFNQQFKRSCLPDGPAVCEVSLSPRGGWLMPSDASSAIWLEEVKMLKEQI